jgi:glycosyltransferase involved in cell wall biosynthesis
MRIAWFTPFNPGSAIGHYSEAAVAGLRERDEVVVFASDAAAAPPRPADPPAVPLGPRPDPDLPRQLDDFDVAVYNMGNHAPYHKTIFDLLIQRPGVVVLHDLVMRDFFRDCFLQGGRNDPDGFARCLSFSEGPGADAEAEAVRQGRHAEAVDDQARLHHPMFKAVLHRCLAVVVHSEYSRARVAAAVGAPAVKVDFPLFGPAAALAPAAPRRPGGRIRLLTFGVLHRNKLIHSVVATLAASTYLRARAEYVVVGSGDKAYTRLVRELAERFGLGGVVRLEGRLSDDGLRAELAAADVVVNLRNPHFGESSASLLDALVAGAATVVWDHGFYGEFPDNVVCKIASEAELGPALERLCRDRGLRERVGAAARRHALARFDTALYCRRLRAVLEEARSARPVWSLIDVLSDRLLEFGPRPPEGLPERLAAEVAALAATPAGLRVAEPAADPAGHRLAAPAVARRAA